MFLAAAQRNIICTLYLYGLPFVVVLPLLLLAGVVFIGTSSAAVVVHTSTAAAAVDAIRRVVYGAAAVRTATKNGSVFVFLDVRRYFSAFNHDHFLYPLA